MRHYRLQQDSLLQGGYASSSVGDLAYKVSLKRYRDQQPEAGALAQKHSSALPWRWCHPWP